MAFNSIVGSTEQADDGRWRQQWQPDTETHSTRQATSTGWTLACDRGDDLEAPLGSVCSSSSSKARLVTASSVSSSRIRP